LLFAMLIKNTATIQPCTMRPLLSCLVFKSASLHAEKQKHLLTHLLQ